MSNLSSRKRKRRSIREIVDDEEYSDLEWYALTGEPPDSYPDEDLFDPESYWEKKQFWDNALSRHRMEKMKRSEAAIKAWETRRARYGPSGRRKKKEDKE